MTKPTCVHVWTEEVADGEYEHYVALCDDDGEPIEGEEIRICYRTETALGIADRLAASRGGLEVITDDLMR